MNRTKRQPNNATPGFAIRLTDQPDLGIAMLIAEYQAAYEPLGPVSTIAEAREIAQQDLRDRMRRLEAGEEPACPAIYRVWARGLGGCYAVAANFDPSHL